jgi:co-chaperonin GroES (HSP10)
MFIRPVLHRVLVKPDDISDTDETLAAAKRIKGFEIVGKELEREQGAVDTGVVVLVGSTVGNDFSQPGFVQVGQRVVYAKYGGKAIVHPKTKEKFVALNDEDIIAIFEEEAQDE